MRAGTPRSLLPETYGRGGWIRTSGPLIPNQVRYRAALRLDKTWWLRQALNLRTSGFSDRRSTKLSYTARRSLILVGIELVRTRHRDAYWRERMQDVDRSFVVT